MRKNRALLLLLSNPQVIAQHYSPSISRTIPAPVAIAWPKLLNEWLVVGFVSGILLFLIVSMSLKMRTQLAELTRLEATRVALAHEMAHWQKVTTEYPAYRDGYFRLAMLQYQLGNEQLASMYTEKTLALDPQFVPAREFKEKLGKE